MGGTRAQKRRGHEDGGEHVVEIVRDAGGEEAEVLKALGAVDLLLQLLFLRDVGGDLQIAGGLPAFIADEREDELRHQAAALAGLEGHLAAPLAGAQDLLAAGRQALHGAARENLVDPAAEHLAGVQAAQGGGPGVAVGHAVVEIGHEDGHRGALDDVGLLAELGLVLARVEHGRGDAPAGPSRPGKPGG